MKNILRFYFLLVFLFGSQSFAATYSATGGAFTPPGTASGVVTFPVSVAGEPGNIIPGGTEPDINVPAILGYNTEITNITLINAQHTFASDLDLRLISPNGTTYTFNTDNGGSTGLDVASDIIFDVTSTGCADFWTSSTSATQPENGLLFETSENNCGPIEATFTYVCTAGTGEIVGDAVNGTWILEITDDAGGDTGSFTSFSITFGSITPPTVDSNAVSIDPLACVDTTPPVITAPADISIESTGNLTPVNIGMATATDDSDPAPVITNNSPGAFPLGDTTVTWTAEDASGNTDTDTQTVTILPCTNFTNLICVQQTIIVKRQQFCNAYTYIPATGGYLFTSSLFGLSQEVQADSYLISAIEKRCGPPAP